VEPVVSFLVQCEFKFAPLFTCHCWHSSVEEPDFERGERKERERRREEERGGREERLNTLRPPRRTL